MGELMTIKEVKEYLRISSNTTIYKLIALKSFPKLKIGKDYKIPKNLLDKWIENNIGNEILL